jgi:uncharacterized membrane protein YdjX (TVP38/TMEM64 family)
MAGRRRKPTAAVTATVVLGAYVGRNGASAFGTTPRSGSSCGGGVGRCTVVRPSSSVALPLHLSSRDESLWGSGKAFRQNSTSGSDDQASKYQQHQSKSLQKIVSKTSKPFSKNSLQSDEDESGATTSFSTGGAISVVALFGLGYYLLHNPQASSDDYFSAISQFNPASLLQGVVDKVDGMGPNGALYFGLLYIIAEVFAIPAMPLTASAGYLFGWQEGTAVVLCSATIAASISFVIARTFLRQTVSELIQQNPRFLVLDRAIGKEGFKLMLLVRLSPIFPFALSNYLYGVTSIPFGEYFWGTLIGFAPGTFAYVYTGDVGKALLTNVDSAQPWYVYAAGLTALAGVLKVVADYATGVFEEIEAEDAAETMSGKKQRD